jgi:hypothetical protein
MKDGNLEKNKILKSWKNLIRIHRVKTQFMI